MNLNQQESEDVSVHLHLPLLHPPQLHPHPPLVLHPHVPQLEAASDIFSTDSRPVNE